MTRIIHYRTLFPLLVVVALVLPACGPKREETWNSYYYGTSREGMAFYGTFGAFGRGAPSRGAAAVQDKGQDNDDTYVLPPRHYHDDQPAPPVQRYW